GLRCPSHPVAQALLQAFKEGKGGVAAPSANKFGRVSPTTAQHVRDEFGSGPHSLLACILDGGQSEVGIESTILDLSRMATHGPVLLRPGQISAASIAQVIGVVPRMPDAAAPRASGTLEAHYAPNTPVALLAANRFADTLQQLVAAGRRAAVIHITSVEGVKASAQRGMPVAPEAYAHDLYAALRSMDEVGADIILVESPPTDDVWQGVNDRLRRAAHDSLGALARLLIPST
ncbi:MAG TPA: Sua5 family C-terminal domain-containing protein, partial [Noviherbaspirillum sp.]|nr:Sua5 family C-terminal domain-containing protein [Noviherbaspirillum sp.]